MLAINGLRHVQVAPVLVREAILQGLGNRRRGAEIHIRDPHADGDAARAVQADLPVPLRAVRADSVVDGVEVVLSIRWLVGKDATRMRRGGANAGGSDECRDPRALEEIPAIERCTRRHAEAPFRPPRGRQSDRRLTTFRAYYTGCQLPVAASAAGGGFGETPRPTAGPLTTGCDPTPRNLDTDSP